MPPVSRHFPESTRLIWQSCAAWVCCLSLALAQVPQPRTITWGTPNGQELSHCAILGEIAQPGVYSSSEKITLQRLISSAGGLTPLASPSVRIIRRDYTGQAVFFRPTGEDNLQSGDFVLVDALRGVAEPATDVAPHAGQSRAKGFWVGLMGVSDRPIVVPLDPEWARLPTIIQALGQDPQLARSARMVYPHLPSHVHTPEGAIPSGTIVALPPTQVLRANLPEFPAARPMTLSPNLATTKPFLMETASNHTEADFAPPSPVGTPQPPAPPQIDQPSNVFSIPLPEGDSQTLPPAPSSRDISASMLPYSAPGRIDTSANPASLPAPGSRMATLLAPNPPAPSPAVPQTALQPGNLPPLPLGSPADSATSGTPSPSAATLPNAAQSPNLVSPDRSDWPAPPDEIDLVGEPPRRLDAPLSPSISLWQILGISGTVASLIGVALGTRHYLDTSEPSSTESGTAVAPEIRRQSAVERGWQFRRETLPLRAKQDLAAQPQSDAVSPIPHPTSDAVPLEALLANRIPMDREPVEFPTGLSLQQRTLEESLSWRVDSAHSSAINAPHLTVAALTTAAAATTTGNAAAKAAAAKTPAPKSSTPILERDVPAASKVPRPHFRMPPATTTQSATDQPAAEVLQPAVGPSGSALPMTGQARTVMAQPPGISAAVMPEIHEAPTRMGQDALTSRHAKVTARMTADRLAQPAVGTPKDAMHFAEEISSPIERALSQLQRGRRM